jgi:assimilatory nitrate reductase catalytic subunit
MISAPAALSVAVTTSTHCPYCALQCAMRVGGVPQDPVINGDDTFPVNRGALCVKGWTAGDTLAHPERLLSPLVRDRRGALVPASWDDALERVARAFRDLQARHGRDAVGVFGSGALTNEKAYLLGKFARVALRTAQIDYNGRFCMSSAAAAANAAFGIDRGLPFPVEDIAKAEVIVLAGGNVAETMPPLLQYFEAQRARGGRLIVIDPRRSATAALATLHLRLTPGSDVAIANGLLHILVRDRLVDEAYIEDRTEGFALVRAAVAAYWPERVERITGVPRAQLVDTAQMLGRARTAIVLTARGAEQHAHGVDSALAYINIALALGKVGAPFSGYGCLTGQGNGQGGREHGQKADQLPGYRRIDDAAARKHVAAVWGVGEDELPGPGRSAYEMLDSMGCDGGIRALFVLGSNVVVSAPRALHVEERLKALDSLVVSDFFLSETARLADVVLPAAQWAEEDGTMTNLEGRVIRRHRVFDSPAGVRTDLDMMCDLAARLGAGRHFDFSGPEAVFDELRRASAGGRADYAGVTYDRVDAEGGVFWPCPAEDHPGTPRLFSDRFATPSGRGRFHAVHHRPPVEEPDREYPLYLTTGRVLAQYQSGTQTRRVARLQQIAPEPTAEMHPSTARRHRLATGDLVTLATRRGSATFTVQVTPGIREDTVFVPFHWGDAGSANRLTNPALDPVSRMPEFKACAVRVEHSETDAPRRGEAALEQ